MPVVAGNQPIAEFFTELLDLSGQRFTRVGFTRLLAAGAGRFYPGCEVAVVLFDSPGGPAVFAGPTGRAEQLVVSWGVGGAAGCAALECVALECVALEGDTAPIGVIGVFAPVSVPAAGRELLALIAGVAAGQLRREAAFEVMRVRVEQLEGALSSRVVIEQAKGMLAERFGMPMESAFATLRNHSRNHNTRLPEVCAAVIGRDPQAGAIRAQFAPMSGSRRELLRETAMTRCREAQAAALAAQSRAGAAQARSMELRDEVDAGRAARDMDALGRAIDRHFQSVAQAVAGSRPRDPARPQVLLTTTRTAVRTFATGALGGRRLDLRSVDPDAGEVLGAAVVAQPDLVIFGPDLPAAGGGELLARLHRHCPDTRTLLVVEHEAEIPAFAGYRIDRRVRAGDTPRLLACTLQLCGLVEAGR